jgi:uroporphyrin-III C-methyltransferase
MPHETLTGRVALVGAGPGPADLMTVRALRAVEGAQALLYDALISDEVLALAPRACLRIQTGKRAGGASMKQETINRLMLRLARRGLTVVRLKGGDPSVFGRVGEEQAYLEAHGVSVEVVPGVTAASAAAAQFGFPLTHRGVARSVAFATARIQDGSVVEAGWNSKADHTPAIAVENAGHPTARLIASDLMGLPERLAHAGCDGPVLLVIGEAAGLARMAEITPHRLAERRVG